MDTLEQKEQKILERFSDCQKSEDIYNKIIEMGQKAGCVKEANFNEKDLVPGCQSLRYLVMTLKEEKLYFKAYSEALISKGLAELLVWYYSGESAETILKCPPTFLEKLKIPNSLTPSRVNGLYNIHLKMKQKALETLVSPKSA